MSLSTGLAREAQARDYRAERPAPRKCFRVIPPSGWSAPTASGADVHVAIFEVGVLVAEPALTYVEAIKSEGSRPTRPSSGVSKSSVTCASTSCCRLPPSFPYRAPDRSRQHHQQAQAPTLSVATLVTCEQHAGVVVLGVGQPWASPHPGVHRDRVLEVSLGCVPSPSVVGEDAEEARYRAERDLTRTPSHSRARTVAAAGTGGPPVAVVQGGPRLRQSARGRRATRCRAAARRSRPPRARRTRGAPRPRVPARVEQRDEAAERPVAGIAVDRLSDEVLDLRQPTLRAAQHEHRRVGTSSRRPQLVASPDRNASAASSSASAKSPGSAQTAFCMAPCQSGRRLPQLLGQRVESIVQRGPGLFRERQPCDDALQRECIEDRVGRAGLRPAGLPLRRSARAPRCRVPRWP